MKNKFLKWVFVLFCLCEITNNSALYGAVTVTLPATLTFSGCTNTAYQSLGSIVIDENNNADFGFASGANFTITFSLGGAFQFETGGAAPSAAGNGADVNIVSITRTATSFTITYNCTEVLKTNEDDRITISGLRVRATGTTATQTLIRIGGTGVINGFGVSSVCGNFSCTCPPMTFTSSDVTQSSTAPVATCEPNQDVQIVRLEVTTGGGSGSPLNMTSIRTQYIGTGGGSSQFTIRQIYYTGTDNNFNTGNLFGAATTGAGFFDVTGNQNLVLGTNYFWLVYDLVPNATVNNLLDGVINSFILSGTTQYPTIISPIGTRTILACNAPGGVYTGLEIWLKANAGISGGAPITAWANQKLGGSGISVHGAPNLNSSSTAYNYNPYVDFIAPAGVLAEGHHPDRQFLKVAGLSGYNVLTLSSLFFAFQLNDLSRVDTHIATADRITLGEIPTPTPLHGSSNGGGLATFNAATFYCEPEFGGSAPGNTWHRNGISENYNTVHSNTKHILSANSQTGAGAGLNTFLGGQVDNDLGTSTLHQRDWRGPVSELIAYTIPVSPVEKQRIDTYLAIKYGITKVNDFLSTSGSTIFTNNAPYNTNIIGIGRDDIEELNQKQSHQNDDSVRIYVSTIAGTNLANTGSFSSDISYVVQGANSGKLCRTAASNTEIPSPSLTSCALVSRLEREWKVTRTNNSQNYNMDIKLNSCATPASVNVAHLRLLVDDDGNFANGGTQCYYNGDGSGLVFSYSNPTITLSEMSTSHIPNNATRFITIASINIATPLPIELINFDAKLNKEETVDLTWETSTERDNDFFTVEKSVDGSNWDFLTKIDGAGTSSTSNSYVTEDLNPNVGMNYYRLKQTDFNGVYSYSDTRSVEIKNQLEIHLFPNPADKLVNVYGINSETDEIQVTNSLGQVVQVEKHITSKDQVEFNTSALENGIYYVNIVSQNKRQTLKLSILNNRM